MKKFLKIALIIFAVLLLIVVIALRFVDSKLDKINYVTENSTSGSDAASQDKSDLAATDEMRNDLEFSMPTEEKQDDDQILNVLLIGSDYRIDGTSDPGRADCNMICSVNTATGEIKLISIERGIYVPIPADSNPYGATSDLITHAFHWGGADLSESIVSECFNINLEGYVHVDLENLTQIFDAIGGIDVEMTAVEANKVGVTPIDGSAYDEGDSTTTKLCHMDGAQAILFCRLRSVDSDWMRTGRQRRALSAAINKAKNLSISEFNSLVDVVLPLLDTNVPKSTITYLLTKAPKIFASLSIQQMMVPDQNWNNGYIACDFDYESKKISNFIYGTNYELGDPGYVTVYSD